MTDLISIVVPIYNIKDYLPKCLDSILHQTYKNYELILVDDGSTDGSSEICDLYAGGDPRIKVIHKNNEGVSAARNDGINLSVGTYLSFIDGDDWIEPEYLERLFNVIINNKADVAAVGFREVYADGSCKTKKICDSLEVLSPIEALNQAVDPVRPWVGYAWGKLIKSSVIKENSVTYDQEISLCEDSLFNYNAFQCIERAVKVPDILYNYYIRNDSVTRTATVNYSIFRTKITALEKASFIVENFVGETFYYRINNALFSEIISYLAAMFSNKVYEKDTVNEMKTKLKKLEERLILKNCPRGGPDTIFSL